VAAHIHAGPAVAPGVNGPVVWGFFGTPFNDNNPNDVVNTPFATGVGGTISGKWDAPEGNATTLTAQVANVDALTATVWLAAIGQQCDPQEGAFLGPRPDRDPVWNRDLKLERVSIMPEPTGSLGLQVC